MKRTFALAIASWLMLGSAQLAVAAPTTAPLPAAPLAKAQPVTLITGDRVLVGTGNPPAVAIQQAKGREGMRFQTYRANGHLHVIPLDALPLLQAGKLDRRLFDLTALVELGYSDLQRDT